MTASLDLVPSSSGIEQEIALLGAGGVDLNGLLQALLTELPEPDKKGREISAMPKVEEFPEEIRESILRLPEVIHSVLPATRRRINGRELDRLRQEKEVVSELRKFLDKREKAIHEIISTHMDVVAESKSGFSKQGTPRDPKGHYCIASPGNPEKAPIPGTDLEWHRERSADKSVLDEGEFNRLRQEGELTDQEVRLVARRVVTYVIDQSKIDMGLRDPAKVPLIKSVIRRISRKQRGINSINLRKAK